MKKMLFVLLAMMLVLTACAPAVTPVATSAPVSATEAVAATAAPVEPTAAAVEPTAAPAEPTAAPAEPTAVPQAGPKKIIVGLGPEDYPQLGWAIDGDDAFSLLYIGVLETLVNIDFEGNLIAGLAESWKQLDDTTWEFTLRSGVTFTNGEPFNSAAVIKALQYVINSPTPPRGITKDTFLSIEASGDNKVVIKTAAFDALLPNRLTSANTGIMAPSAYIAASGPIDPFNTGTGPFILTKQVAEQNLDLVKNPNYWGGKVNIDEATVLFVPDPQVRAGMLQTGEIDIDIHVPVEQIATLETDFSA